MKKDLITREQDYAQWYLEVIAAADLAEHSDVRGAMIIKPYGYAIWERMQLLLDEQIKATGHRNAYFPLFIPKSFLSKEAAHVEGFAKECAVVTHYRLKTDPNSGALIVDPEAKLEEELIVRPTSETIIHSSFARWIKSWRDLPLLINQWANVVRWEMRPRLFLRTSEFLWQEGHTAHATHDDAAVEVEKMLKVYQAFVEDVLAIPVIPGKKTSTETFAGAEYTYTIEAMMQDGKALQAGTSHHLGQNFAKAFEVKYVDQTNTEQYCWMTSWGVSTRLMGALIMSHSDDKGLVLPPNIAPVQVVILPLWKTDEEKKMVMEQVETIQHKLTLAHIRLEVDARDYESFGSKAFTWEKKGVPLRIEVGPRDLAKQQVMLARRDTSDKQAIAIGDVTKDVKKLLKTMQKTLFKTAQNRLRTRTYNAQNYETFKTTIDKGGFFLAGWCGEAKCEELIKIDTKATIRCIPFKQSNRLHTCLVCGNPAKEQVVLARAY